MFTVCSLVYLGISENSFFSTIQFLIIILNQYFSGRHEFYYDDDHELGELGDTADVACDFGGDFGGF